LKWGYPQSSSALFSDFPANKPTSYWGSPIYGTPRMMTGGTISETPRSRWPGATPCSSSRPCSRRADSGATRWRCLQPSLQWRGVSGETTVGFHVAIIHQWIGLRENLQETMVFTIKYRIFLQIFPSSNSMIHGFHQERYEHHQVIHGYGYSWIL